MYNDLNLIALQAERKKWLTVDVSCLSKRNKQLYIMRKMAVDMYIEGFTLNQICKYTGIKGKSEPLRLLRRCISYNEFAQQFGYTALINYKHTKKKDGTLQSLLEKNPNLKNYIIEQYRNKNISIKTLHSNFLIKCIQQGISYEEYPFNKNDFGLRSFYSYLRNK